MKTTLLFLGRFLKNRIKEKYIEFFVNPLNRRYPGGHLKALPNSYFRRQDYLLSEKLLPRLCDICNSGYNSENFEQLLKKPEYSEIGERIVEYSWIFARLKNLQLNSDHNKYLLDVGCVLNRDIISKYIESMFETIWFMNPAWERVVYKKNVGYILSDIRYYKIPDHFKFDCVTCLSTLEHIGMDTKRYGGPGGEVNIYKKNPEKNAIEAVKSLCHLVRPGGRLFLSMPYGNKFEYLYDYNSSIPNSYTFDQRRLEELLKNLPENTEVISKDIYKVIHKVGWVKTGLNDRNISDYGVNCAGAGAVSLLEIKYL